MNLIKERLENRLELIDIRLCEGDITQTLRKTINTWDPMKLKNFYMTNDTTVWGKSQAIEWEKFFTNYTFNRGLISKIYKEIKKIRDFRKIQNPI